ncbi:hypothetical protein Tco_0576964 [Tanacetum coccineum]
MMIMKSHALGCHYTLIFWGCDNYRLPVDALMKVSPDVPPPPPASGIGTSTAVGIGDVVQRSSPPIQKTTGDTPFVSHPQTGPGWNICLRA